MTCAVSSRDWVERGAGCPLNHHPRLGAPPGSPHPHASPPRLGQSHQQGLSMAWGPGSVCRGLEVNTPPCLSPACNCAEVTVSAHRFSKNKSSQGPLFCVEIKAQMIHRTASHQGEPHARPAGQAGPAPRSGGGQARTDSGAPAVVSWPPPPFPREARFPWSRSL